MTTVVITGSTRGLGFGLARRFLDKGCSVVINGASDLSVRRALGQLSSYGESLHGVTADVSSREEVERLCREATERFGPPDIWVNNAGISHPHLMVWELDAETVQRVAGINIQGVVNGTVVPFKAMQKRGTGKIFSMEGHGSNGFIIDGMSIYGTTKCAVHYFVRAFAHEAKQSGITIGALSPGMVVTDMLLDTVREESAETLKRKRLFNMLADDVETVSEFLVTGMLGVSGPYVRIQWLTRKKALFRMLFGRFRKRDFFRA
jgi:NAD(P)-dependent dehydrogenase (short-subunit alcohol dehydrogenase family)